MTKKWYAVYTKPGYEKKVNALLTRKKFESYCPMIGAMKQKKLVYNPLLPRYVFVKASEAQLKPITYIKNVISLLYWFDKPVAIKNDEIEAIKQFVRDNENIHLEKLEPRTENQKPFIGKPQVTIEERMMPVKNKMVKVLHTSLGYSITAEVDQVETEVIYRDTKEKHVFLKHYDQFHKS